MLSYQKWSAESHRLNLKCLKPMWVFMRSLPLRFIGRNEYLHSLQQSPEGICRSGGKSSASYLVECICQSSHHCQLLMVSCNVTDKCCAAWHQTCFDFLTLYERVFFFILAINMPLQRATKIRLEPTAVCQSLSDWKRLLNVKCL